LPVKKTEALSLSLFSDTRRYEQTEERTKMKIETNEERKETRFRRAVAGWEYGFGESQFLGLGGVVSAADPRPKKGSEARTPCRSGKQSFTSLVLTHGS